MAAIDKKIKELYRNIEVPEDYDRKVDELLETLPEKETVRHRRRRGRKIAVLAVCSICIIIFLNRGILKADANIFQAFKTTILDFLSGGSGEENSEDIGLNSNKTSVASRPDLRMELQEMVVSSHNIYLLVRITAPPEIQFAENISFEYFAFSTGENFNTENLLGGAKECELLEIMEGKQNIAAYAVSLTTDDVIEDGSKIAAYFENLSVDPYSDDPDRLVEGIWSISFQADYTVRDSVTIEGDDSMTVPFLGTTAAVESLELTPLGLVLVSDVSKAPYDDLGISDTTIEIRLKLVDGEELVVASRDDTSELITQSGSFSYETVEDKTTQTAVYEFSTALDLNKVAGIYIEDLFLHAN